ncbi:MAG: hypothetical protein ABEN55_00600 [Bradymonadaceae bacterium]
MRAMAGRGVNMYITRLTTSDRLNVSKHDIRDHWTLNDVVEHLEMLDFWDYVDRLQREHQQRKAKRNSPGSTSNLSS